jgi:hypothetical protein
VTSRPITACLIAATCLIAPPARGQTASDTVYSVEVTATASSMFNFFRLPKVPGTSDKTSIGYGVSIRAVWHPARLLAVGLLTGYFALASDDIAAGDGSAAVRYDAALSAVPMQFAISMQKAGFEFGLGIGPYLMLTSIEGTGGGSASGKRLEIGTTVFTSYTFDLGESMRLGPELRVVSLRYRGILSVMPSLSFRIDPVRY